MPPVQADRLLRDLSLLFSATWTPSSIEDLMHIADYTDFPGASGFHRTILEDGRIAVKYVRELLHATVLVHQVWTLSESGTICRVYQTGGAEHVEA